MDVSLFPPLFDSLKSAPTAPGMHRSLPACSIQWFYFCHTDAKAAADKLAREVSKQGFISFQSVVCTMSLATV
jgi:hypothetical protein